MSQLRAMLSESFGEGVPLWGSHGFPYRCGVTKAEFVLWALSPDDTSPGETLNITLKGTTTVGTLLRRFCEDCPARQRRQAQAAGSCVQPVLTEYRSGGRPPERMIREATKAEPGITRQELSRRFGLPVRSIDRVLARSRSGSRSKKTREAIA